MSPLSSLGEGQDENVIKVSFLPPSYTDQGGEESEGYESEEQLQLRILTAALEFVPTHGWTADAIAEGAKVHIEKSDSSRDQGPP